MTLRVHLFAAGLFVGLAAAMPVVAEGVAPSGGLVQAGSGTQDVAAQDVAARIRKLTDTMMMGDLFAVMRQEGVEYGKSLEDDLFPGQGGTSWATIVGLIYDGDTMRRRFDDAFVAELSTAGDDLALIEAFFGSDRGQRILKLEVEARRALLDPAAEDASKQAWADLSARDDPRAVMLTTFAEVNDLIESNVMGTMNSNLAFYRGMAENPAFGDQMPEDQILSDVWAQEADIRTETTQWLFSYLSLAYGALSDDDLQAYIDFSKTAAGQKANAALFAAFDKVFDQISRDLGRAAAKQAQGEDI